MVTLQLVELESVRLELEMVTLQLVELESVRLELEMVTLQLVELESVRLELEMVAPVVGQTGTSQVGISSQIGICHGWVSQTGMHLTGIGIGHSCAGTCLTRAGVSELITVASG